jgi:hypothetical protein
MNNQEYDLEAEASLQGLANRIAMGRGPREMAEGIIDLLFNSSDEASRSRRRALAKLFAEMSEQTAREHAVDEADAECWRGLAAKLRAVEVANS